MRDGGLACTSYERYLRCASFWFQKKSSILFHRGFRHLYCLVFRFVQTLGQILIFLLTIFKKVPQAKWRYSKVLSIFHMSMVIFPYIFHNFHMSGVKKSYKNQKQNLRAAPRVVGVRGDPHRLSCAWAR